MIRRLAAAVMAVAMLHLSVTPGAAACVDHATMASAHVAASPASELHEVPGHGAHAFVEVATQTPAPPCDAPAPPSCCSAIAGCATIGLTSQCAAAPPALAEAAPAHDSPAVVATSRRASPEPPPPKR